MIKVRLSGLLLGRWAKPAVFALALGPLVWLLGAAATNHLGANPAEALLRGTGDWTLRLLCVVLAVTPLRKVGHLPALARFRRMLGLFVFFYAFMHLLAYSWFDKGLEFADIAKDIVKRPAILVGFMALVLLSTLAATSFNRAIRALGGRRWQALHRLVYVVPVLALLHFYWLRQGKNNFFEPAVYACIVALLLGWRVLHKSSQKARQSGGR